MTQSKTLIIVLVIGFGAGFVLRPVIVPVDQAAIVADPPAAAPTPAEPRAMQYFVRQRRASGDRGGRPRAVQEVHGQLTAGGALSLPLREPPAKAPVRRHELNGHRH